MSAWPIADAYVPWCPNPCVATLACWNLPDTSTHCAKGFEVTATSPHTLDFGDTQIDEEAPRPGSACGSAVSEHTSNSATNHPQS